MTKTNAAKKAPIDREAEELKPVNDAAPAAPAPAPEAEPAMPTAENAPPCLFKPGNGITTTDVLEIAIMYLLQLSNSEATFAPGTLRQVPLNADRVGMLSEQARQWMKPVGEPLLKPKYNRPAGQQKD